MPVYLGSATVALKLGTQSVSGYVGNTLVTASVPSAPVLVSAINDGLMEVYFRAPTSDGGSPITGYTFILDGDEQGTQQPNEIFTQSGGSGASAYDTIAEWNSISVDGQTLTVYATNAIGNSPVSNSIVVNG